MSRSFGLYTKEGVATTVAGGQNLGFPAMSEERGFVF